VTVVIVTVVKIIIVTEVKEVIMTLVTVAVNPPPFAVFLPFPTLKARPSSRISIKRLTAK
jgi:hypothetical protein